MKRDRDWADQAASMIVEAHINTWGMVPHPDYIKESVAASLRAVRNGSLGPSAFEKGAGGLERALIEIEHNSTDPNAAATARAALAVHGKGESGA